MSELIKPHWKDAEIESVKANNFKSLLSFELKLDRFTCLIGLNGAGKSTILQFMDFLAQQVRGDIDGWLKEREWLAKDLHSKLSQRRTIDFEMSIKTGSGHVQWNGRFNPSKLQCGFEQITTPEWMLIVKSGHFSIYDLHSGKPTPEHREQLSFTYEGSILSQLDRDRKEFIPFFELKDYLSNIRSLDLLSPHSIRKKTRIAEGWMGLGGERLSALLFEMEPQKRKKIASSLKKAYSHFTEFQTRSLKSGWKQLEIKETFGKEVLSTEARHINDGLLRLIAILAETQSDHPLLLFDEIENGINPEIVGLLIEILTTAKQQTLATTHNPLILNYLTDEQARKGVIYVYKSPEGSTRCLPFFSIPSQAKKLTVMGPGEVFVDTDLSELDQEIYVMSEGS